MRINVVYFNLSSSFYDVNPVLSRFRGFDT